MSTPPPVDAEDDGRSEDQAYHPEKDSQWQEYQEERDLQNSGYPYQNR